MDRSDPTDLSKQFELVLESNRAKRGVTDLNVAAAAIRFEGLFSRLPADLRQREKEDDPKADKDSGQKPKKKRTADYQLPEAFVTEWRYSIVPPAGFKPKPLPANAQLSLRARYSHRGIFRRQGWPSLRYLAFRHRETAPDRLRSYRDAQQSRTTHSRGAYSHLLRAHRPDADQPGQGAGCAAVLS